MLRFKEIFMSLISRLVGLGVAGIAPFALAEMGSAIPPTSELLAFHTSDADFKPVEVAPWVQQSTIQAFVAVEDIAKVAGWGVQVVHGGGPDPYFPLMEDDPKAGPPEVRRKEVQAFVAEARKHKLRVLVGINPAAPVPYVRAHPEWMVCHTTDFAAIRARVDLDLDKPENHGFRSLGLTSPYGDYLIENL